MKSLKFVFLSLVFIASISIAQSEQKFAKIGNFNLTSGDTLLNCKIGYRTFGKLNEDSSNVIINPTWFGGTTEHLAKLIGPGKLIDDSKYFVIAIDALANGVSTSPSNSELQSGKNFPKISVDDMVKTQHILLTEVFGLKHVFAVVGGSMGSMQTLQWIVTYPNFIDKAVPYVASPRRTTYERLFMAFKRKMIESYQELGADDSLILTMINYTTQLSAYSPEYRIEKTTHEEFSAYIEKVEHRKPSKTFTIENYLAQLQAMETYNIYKSYNNSATETAKHIKTKVFFILGKHDMLVHPSAAREFAKFLGSNVLELDSNCGHICVGCELKKSALAIDKFLSGNN